MEKLGFLQNNKLVNCLFVTFGLIKQNLYQMLWKFLHSLEDTFLELPKKIVPNSCIYTREIVHWSETIQYRTRILVGFTDRGSDECS